MIGKNSGNLRRKKEKTTAGSFVFPPPKTAEDVSFVFFDIFVCFRRDWSSKEDTQRDQAITSHTTLTIFVILEFRYAAWSTRHFSGLQKYVAARMFCFVLLVSVSFEIGELERAAFCKKPRKTYCDHRPY